jgi:hypothetical protein
MKKRTGSRHGWTSQPWHLAEFVRSCGDGGAEIENFVVNGWKHDSIMGNVAGGHRREVTWGISDKEGAR